jgi:hypothetical protein
LDGEAASRADRQPDKSVGIMAADLGAFRARVVSALTASDHPTTPNREEKWIDGYSF